MKKKLFYGFAILAIAAIAAFNMHVSSKGGGLSDMSLANVEALARNEGGTNWYQIATVTEPYGNGGTITYKCCKEGGNLLDCGGYHPC